ncbi:unnamed protein product [Phytomonas sp. EM1]|nr:unnamed protein product [Phytomonas sp. EM1]|eukprot:CCW65038.1 unnamed protein product [Phytomonas sp. isolate EM1]
MINSADMDSMWLQKSITLPDPLPNDNGISPGKEEQAPQMASLVESGTTLAEQKMSAPTQHFTGKNTQTEAELTKMTLNTISLMDSTQRSSTARHSVRVSLSNIACITAQEYDKLRSLYSQAKRELLKLADVQRDLEYARFELNRTQEELKLARTSNEIHRKELEDALDRAEKEHRARLMAESKANDERTVFEKEVDFLKRRIEDLRQDNCKRLDELSQQHEFEGQNCLQTMSSELEGAVAEIENMSQEISALQQDKENLEKQYGDTLSKLQKAYQDIDDWRKKSEAATTRFSELEKQHQEHIKRIKAEHEEAMQAQHILTNERMEEITTAKNGYIKELEDDLQRSKEKLRVLTDDVAALRHTNSKLSEEMEQISMDHAKELHRIAEEHRLALSDKEHQMESAVRAAKGSRIAAAEENLSLQRQLSKVSEELSTISVVLTQREKQLLETEKLLSTTKARELELEHEINRLTRDGEVHCTAAVEANERILRLNEQKDIMEEGYSTDLRAAKERIYSLEESLMSCREELSVLRKEHMKSTDDDRAVVRQLRLELTAATADRDRFYQEIQAKQHEEGELRQKYLSECQRSDNLNVELAAAIHRCSLLEKRLEVELRRRVSGIRSTTPINKSQSSHCQSKLRSASSVNIPSPDSRSMKRSRTEDARVFAISGFDGNDLFLSIKQLPNVAIAECKSNMPVPSNLTHLITNGQLTIKLLTALVRGCWVLPVSYVVESLNQRMWLNENDFGFQHEFPPLLKKQVFCTNLFVACKHYSTAALLLSEGGAITVDSAENADIVLCTNDELSRFERGMNWEKMVEVIYPVRIE